MEQNAAFHAVLEEFRVLNGTEPVEKKEPAERSLLVKEKKPLSVFMMDLAYLVSLKFSFKLKQYCYRRPEHHNKMS